MQRAFVLQGISLKKRGKEREKERERERERDRIDTREPGFHGTGLSLYFSGKFLYFGLYIEINVRN